MLVGGYRSEPLPWLLNDPHVPGARDMINHNPSLSTDYAAAQPFTGFAADRV